jgi:hypothetical protein
VGRGNDGRAVGDSRAELNRANPCRFAEMYRKQSANPAATGAKIEAEEAASDEEALDE